MSLGSIGKSTPVQLSLVVGLLLGAFQAGTGWNRLQSLESRVFQNEADEQVWRERTLQALKAIADQCSDHELRLRVHEKSVGTAAR